MEKLNGEKEREMRMKIMILVDKDVSQIFLHTIKEDWDTSYVSQIIEK